MPDLMQVALETLACDYNEHRRKLLARAAELVQIEKTLRPIMQAGQLRAARVTLGPDGAAAFNVSCGGPVWKGDAYGRAVEALRAANMEPFTDDYWLHPSGWSVLIAWAPAPKAETPASTEQVPA